MSDVQTLELDEVRVRLDRVKSGVERIWDDLVVLYQGRAWQVIGYHSWDALCDAEFGGTRIALPRQQRQEVVCDLRDAGMSTRAIASVVGVAVGTVASDLQATVQNRTVDPPSTITGLDGRTRTATPNRPSVPSQPIEAWDPTEGLSTDDLEAMSQGLALAPLTEVINQLDELSRYVERQHLPQVVDEDGVLVPPFDRQRQQLQAAADRFQLSADHINAYLRSTL
jgi:hypothetical protein